MSYKLYYNTAVCSLSPHIVLCELGLPYTLERVDLKTKQTETGVDYKTVSEKGAVPMLVLPNGEKLTEGAVIVQYLADQKPEANLAPAQGSFERVRLQEWLNYLATDVHKGFSPLFTPIADEAKEMFKQRLSTKFDYLAQKLADKQFLTGNTFTVADAYLFTLLGWFKWVNMDIATWPNLKAYYDRIAERPAVQKALAAEGITQQKAA